MKKTFYSNGKLFLIGEYTVIDGSEAFALPTIYGQYLYVENTENDFIEWKSYDADKSLWFETKLTTDNIRKEVKTGNKVTDILINILHIADKLNPSILQENNGYSISTLLTFSRNWGLGSSSTLINNIAQWFEIDAYKLLAESFGGSGYDIACAQYNTPIIFQKTEDKPKVRSIEFNPDFLDKLYFVYLNKKQNTRSSVAAYRENAKDIPLLNEQVNTIIEQASITNNFETFCTLLNKHSDLMSKPLQMKTIKEELFPDFNGTLKSLGAWGGDFILAASEENPTQYFRSKGYETVIPYSDMILKKQE
ncbi:GYDIA family GHMP kinase [Flavobacterium sp. NRK1]|uniref:GYDIA family GHMP kinase n=1 Tax=Flavobacterium sp. NRK1 TaxID=2954929 RepID=UPI00209262D2|nr:GYDIA family GHMP kinase [Flavobacterium sp. NRK1]MCO6148121.1 GYDIA family GHMP kinase [Flavobacterium sp. NRK1]